MWLKWNNFATKGLKEFAVLGNVHLKLDVQQFFFSNHNVQSSGSACQATWAWCKPPILRCIDSAADQNAARRHTRPISPPVGWYQRSTVSKPSVVRWGGLWRSANCSKSQHLGNFSSKLTRWHGKIVQMGNEKVWHWKCSAGYHSCGYWNFSPPKALEPETEWRSLSWTRTWLKC